MADSVRLPSAIVPTHYDLVYDSVDLENFKFDGHVSIQV